MRSSILLVLLFVVGCSSPPTGLSAELPGTSWTLERVVYDDGRVERGAGERITFEPDGAVLIVSCNTCNGTYRMRGNELRVRTPLACTRRACAPGALELEQLFEDAVLLQRDGAYLIAQGEAPGAAQMQFLPVTDTRAVSPAAGER